MTTDDVRHLRSIFPDELIYRLATDFPFLRIPLKKVEMLKLRDEFLKRRNGQNTRQLAQDLGIPLSTAYSWLSHRSISRGKETPEPLIKKTTMVSESHLCNIKCGDTGTRPKATI